MLGFFKWLISLVWGGGGTIGKVVDAIAKARVDLANTKVEEEKVVLQNQLETLHSTLADLQDARKSTANQPWWMATMACMFGFPFAVHVVLIGIGTNFAAPLGWEWLQWTLHIPPWPKPYAEAELGIIQFFYGYAAVSTSVAHIANAIVKRK